MKDLVTELGPGGPGANPVAKGFEGNEVGGLPKGKSIDGTWQDKQCQEQYQVGLEDRRQEAAAASTMPPNEVTYAVGEDGVESDESGMQGDETGESLSEGQQNWFGRLWSKIRKRD